MGSHVWSVANSLGSIGQRYRRKKKRDFCVNNSPIRWEGILQLLMMMK